MLTGNSASVLLVALIRFPSTIEGQRAAIDISVAPNQRFPRMSYRAEAQANGLALRGIHVPSRVNTDATGQFAVDLAKQLSFEKYIEKLSLSDAAIGQRMKERIRIDMTDQNKLLVIST